MQLMGNMTFIKEQKKGGRGCHYEFKGGAEQEDLYINNKNKKKQKKNIFYHPFDQLEKIIIK